MDLAGPELERTLVAFCRSRIAPYKCPRSVDFTPQLPREPTGKLQRRVLRNGFRL
jgi:acyl-coenzyme A synthetase/AMP-(fatty) acid ligase